MEPENCYSDPSRTHRHTLAMSLANRKGALIPPDALLASLVTCDEKSSYFRGITHYKATASCPQRKLLAGI